jgi:hypothetical protein
MTTKVRCITTEYNHYETLLIKIGEVYDIVDEERTWEDNYKMIYIKIGNEKKEYVKANFIPLEDYRQEQLNKIL